MNATNPNINTVNFDPLARANDLAHRYADDVNFLISSISVRNGQIEDLKQILSTRAERLDLAQSEIRSLQIYKATADEVIATLRKERAELQNLIAEFDRQYMRGYSDTSLRGRAWAPIKNSVSSVSPTSVSSVSRPEKRS